MKITNPKQEEMNNKEKIDIFYEALTPTEQKKLVDACVKIIESTPDKQVNLNVPAILNNVRIADSLKEQKSIVVLSVMSGALSIYGLYSLIFPSNKKEEGSVSSRILPAVFTAVGALGVIECLKRHSQNKKLLEIYSSRKY